MVSFQTNALTVGYNGTPLIRDITVTLEPGSILTLIGPNGAGKSTILKSITRQLSPLSGKVIFGDRELPKWTAKEFAKHTAVVLTDRIRPELMTCAEVVAMGRYPYTNLFGKLTEEDRQIVEASLRRVHGLELAQQDFSTLSDGQRQRILLARAICQQPEVIILDEPTAYLDIRHKIELLEILRDMAHREKITVIMSLHEIDLAMKASDKLLCVKGDTIAAYGAPEEILAACPIEALYDMEKGSYDPLFGSVELAKPTGTPEVFVVAGGGFGTSCYRSLQKQQIPFATGILYENDVDFHIARMLTDTVISCPAFEPMSQAQFEQAANILTGCRQVYDAGTPIGSLNAMNSQLLQLAKQEGIPIVPWKRQ